MELLEGMNLERLVRAHGPLPRGRVIHILRQVCESLEEAHAAGLVHRDIKPANIHLGRLGLQRRLRQGARLRPGRRRSAEPDREESLTGAAGMTPGTPAYMAPEMACVTQPVDGRADIYALGCVAYFLLTGHLVFEADTPLQTILKHLQQEPEPPSQRTTNPIPEALERDRARLPGQEPGRPTLERDGACLEARRGQRSFSCQPSSFTPWPDRAYTAWTSWVSGCPTCHPR